MQRCEPVWTSFVSLMVAAVMLLPLQYIGPPWWFASATIAVSACVVLVLAAVTKIAR